MEDQEFRRLLELFPAVRSRDYYLELDASSQSASQSKQKEEVKQLQDGQSKGSIESNTRSIGHGEAFWGKLKAAAEKKQRAINKSYCFELVGPSYNRADTEHLIIARADDMSPAEAEEFCKAFRQVYRKLVDEALSLEAARSLLSS